MRRALALSLLSLLVLAGPAAAEPRPGDLTDTAPPVNGGPDLTSASLDYDTTGSRVRVTLTFAAAPTTTNAAASVIVGSSSGSDGCSPGFAFGGELTGTSATSSWATNGGEQGSGTRSLSGATLVLEASDPRLAADADCFRVIVRPLNGGDDYVFTPRAALRLPDGDADGVPDRDDKCPTAAAPGQPDGCAPPPPTTPTTTTPPPATDPVPPAPKATSLEKYDAAVAKCPAKQGASRTKCLARAKAANKAGYALARKRTTNKFLGKAFFRPDVDVGGFCGGTCLVGMVFTDDRWAYRGEPEDGPILVRCTKTTAVGDKDGCLRYTLSKDRRTATVAGVGYKLSKDGKQITPSGDNGGPLTRVAVPAAGTRVDAAVDSISSFGISGVNQTFSTSEITFSRDGRFVSAGTASGSTGQGDFQSTFTSIGPERRGTYAFEPGGTLSQTFDDGRVVRRSAFVAFGPKTTLGQIARDGLFLDGSFYGNAND